MSLVSCKENKINSSKKIDYVQITSKEKIVDEIQEIGNLFNPERMEQKEIEKDTGKNDYEYTLTNSDLLDKDLQNLKVHSRKIVGIYYKFLIRINKPFNYDKIIIKIIHRNGKIDIFKYSEKEIREIIK
jgi:hypothetical protein